MYPWISKNIFYLPVEIARGEPVLRCQREIEEFELRSSDEIATSQWQKLKKLLVFAYNHNAHYRQVFRESDVVPEDINSLADFQRLPFLTKPLLREKFAILASDVRARVSYRKTSGSTGTPLQLAKDRLASAYMDGYMYHAYSWYGIEMGSKQARIWGIPLSLRGRCLARTKDYLLNRRRLANFELNAANCLQYYNKLRHFKPFFLYGLINPIHEFGRQSADSGVDPRELGLSVIIATGERLNPAKKEYVESVFGCRVVNEYGCTESGIIAFECPAGNLHVASHNLLVEIIDPVTGQPAAPGELGEVTITELHATAMPLIRYRIGDLAHSSTDRCACGRSTPLIGGLDGRISELIPTPDGRKIACALLDYAMPLKVSKYRAVLTATDKLTILLECREVLSERELAAIHDKVSKYLGKQMVLELRIVDGIPSDPSGKLRSFISEVEEKESLK